MSPTQEDVLRKKGYVLRSGLGLQIWGDAFPEGTSAGEASTGTAERQARIRRAIEARKENSGRDQPSPANTVIRPPTSVPERVSRPSP